MPSPGGSCDITGHRNDSAGRHHRAALFVAPWRLNRGCSGLLLHIDDMREWMMDWIPKCRQAIYESVLPRQAGGEVPQSNPGLLVAVADRIDSLVGLFAAKKAPSANADPFGLRRTALGLLEARPSDTDISLSTGSICAAEMTRL